MTNHCRAPVPLVLAFLATGASAVPAPAQSTAPAAARSASFPLLSPSGQELLLERWARGHFRHVPRIRAWVEQRRRMDAEREAELLATPHVHEREIPSSLGVVPSLGPDVIANDRSLTCACNGRPLTQAEPSIAAWDRYAIASWNETRNRCLSGVHPGQSHAFSVDQGATFRERGLLYGSGTNQLRGDPVVAVNHKTGQFYIVGLNRTTTMDLTGIGVMRLHFEGDSLVTDLYQVISLSTPDELHDKPWMAVDSLSGNVYVTWTNFNGATDSEGIELQRLDADLQPLGPRQVLAHNPIPYHDLQNSYPVVGPDGRLFIGWGSFTDGYLPEDSRYEVVRSDDLGVTFTPPSTVQTFRFHLVAMPAGAQRNFWYPMQAMAVDNSAGPHRGRLYVAWPQTRDVFDTVFDSTSVVVEQEPNHFFSAATPFVPGVKLRGFTPNTPEADIWTFEGQRGQIVALLVDSLEKAFIRPRLVCPADTTGLAKLHVLSFAPYGFYAGLPYDGRYYLHVDSPFANEGHYTIVTAFDPPTPRELSRDIRDHFVAWSDDGIAWSAPVRVNDSIAGYDGSHIAISVDGRGRVHAFWFDNRTDPECGARSDQFMASSGDGGVTWGANRRMTDAPSFWGALASCNSNNMGDYTHSAAVGDRIYSTFPDTRMGDPDVFVDVSVFSSQVSCPADRMIASGDAAAIDFTLANGGNFDTALEWDLLESAGWLTVVTPAASGSQLLAAGGGPVTVSATLVPPDGCENAFSTLRFVTRDPFIPGHAETCVTVVRCTEGVPTLLYLAEAESEPGRVHLRWGGADGADVPGRIERQAPGEDWIVIATVNSNAAGLWSYEDRDVRPGRYGYRLTTALEGTPLTTEAWVTVPAGALALRANASGGPLVVAIELPTSDPARLTLHDVAGRRHAQFDLGGMTPGRHEIRLAAGGALKAGIYMVRLSQSGRNLTTKAVIVR